MKISGSNIKKFLKVFYISGNGNPEKIPYISGNGNPIELFIFPETELFLYFRKGIFRTLT